MRYIPGESLSEIRQARKMGHDPYRTAAQMPTQEKEMRIITEKEKDERKSSLENARITKGILFTLTIVGLGFTVGFMLQHDAAGMTYTAQGYGFGVATLGALLFGSIAAARASNLDKFMETYWEQQSELENKKRGS